MFRRRRYFIDKRIQGLFILFVSLAVIVTSVTVGVAVYCLLLNQFTEQISPLVLVKAGFQLFTPGEFAYGLGILCGVLSLSLCIGLFFVLLTHKIVGPLVRFKHVFEAVKQGDYSARVHIRKNDYLHELADSFNAMMDSVEKRHISGKR